MIKVYVLNEYVSSTRNGIGTYLNEFVYCLKVMGVHVCLVIFNSDRQEFCVETETGQARMYFPRFPQGDYASNFKIISRFFRLHISDSCENVFCFNHSPSDGLMQTVKELYPLSKQMYIIHDFLWTRLLLGDHAKLKLIIAKRYQAAISQKHDLLLRAWDREKKMMDIADKVVCLSESTLQVLTDVYRIDKMKIAFVPNALRKKRFVDSGENGEFRRRRFIGRDERVLLFVGRMTEAKGFYALMHALRSVLKACPDVKLVVSGAALSYPFSPFNDISSRVIYTGHISHQELTEWYRIADIGVIPSYTEQCSYVGLEMMMHGLPIVASDGFGLCDMFQDGVNAVVAPIGRRNFPKEFSHNLSEALLRLLSSETLAKELGENARKVFISRYTIQAMRKNYQRLFDSI